MGCASAPTSNNGFFAETEDLTIEKSGLYLSIGKSYEENGQPESAIESYQQSVSINPKNHEAHFYLGKVLLSKSFEKRGIASIEKAFAVNPKYTEARNYLAYLYYDKYKNVKRAHKLINESAEDLVYFNQEETWALKLELDFKNKTSKKSLVSSLDKIFALRPRDCTSRLRIVKTLYKMSLYGTALGAARNAGGICAMPSQQNNLAFLKGLIFIKKKNYLVAEKMLNDIAPENKKFEKRLNNAKTIVRRKINSEF